MTFIANRKRLAGTLVVLGLLAAPGSAQGTTGGRFVPAGLLPNGTSGPGVVAVPLLGSRVLVAGGAQSMAGPNPPGPPLNGAATYDLAMGAFTPVGQMGTARSFAAGAPLLGGRVLVAGGTTPGPAVSTTAEIFNPATGSFSSAGIGQMGTPRHGAAAALLRDGRVLIAGGDNGTAPLASAELFDPGTDTFSSAGIGSMSAARSFAAVAPLPDGRVLILGGDDVPFTGEIFDPATGRFTSIGLTPVMGGPSFPLGDGRVLFTKTYDPGRPFGPVVYDPATGGFSSEGIGPVRSRLGATAAPLPGGYGLLVGGVTDFDTGLEGSPIREAELFTPCCDNDFEAAVAGRTLSVKVKAPGSLTVAPASVTAASAGKRGKRPRKRPAVPPALATPPLVEKGGPGTFAFRLSLNQAGNRKLKRTGAARVAVTITFSPTGGIKKTETMTLRLTAKKKAKKRKSPKR